MPSNTAQQQSDRAFVFSADEYRSRQQRVIERALEQGFDALLIADPANLYYLTGYNAWSFYMPQVLLLPAEGEPLFLMRAMDANGAHRTANGINAANIEGYPEDLVHHLEVHPGEWMAERMREHMGSRSLRVGYEAEAQFFNIRTYLTITSALPNWTFDNCHELVNWVRLIKTPSELPLMRAAGKVVSHAMRTGIDAIWAGRPMNAVAAAISDAQICGVDDADGDYPAIVPMLPTGAGADTPHLTWTNEPLPVGEPISLEIAGAYRRYHAPLARTAVIGTASKRVNQLAAATVDALEAALDTVRPGILADEVSRAYQRVIRAAGFEKTSRLGYSIGIGYPPDWGEHTVSIRPNDETVLEENMCFHLIAGQWEDGFGFENSEPIIVTAAGAELLCDVPRGLFEISLDKSASAGADTIGR